MNKAQALDIAITAMFREILREDDRKEPGSPYAGGPPPPEDDPNPRPQFDFDESTCEHGGLVIERAACPIHGPEAMGPPPTAEELDDITSERAEEANPLIAKARRLAEQRAKREATQRLYPEDLGNVKGMGPPPEDGPPLVV